MQSVAVILAYLALAHSMQPPRQERPERSAVTTLLLALTSGLPQHANLGVLRNSWVDSFDHIKGKMSTNGGHRRTFPVASDAVLSESDLVRLEKARLDGSISKRKPLLLPWIDARTWARSTHMETEEDWKEWIFNGEKKVPLIPSKPDEVYADSGWEGWHDFLNMPHAKDSEGVGKRKPLLLPWERARMWARSTHMETKEDWKEWIGNGEKKIPLIPSKPDEVYADSGWESWNDFLNEPRQ
jgi:hypothetical protein